MDLAPPIIDNASGHTTIVLAHGAGAPMDSDFMNTTAIGLADGGLRVVRFEFPYMTARRADGKKRPPNGQAILIAAWRAAVDKHCDAATSFIGGKSLGGRIASMLADELGVRGLVCLGYPFHPPQKPDELRTAHLQSLVTPTLILQGTRDPFGTPADVATYALSTNITIHWLEDGDHSFVPTKASGRSEADNLAEAVAATLDFVSEHP